MAKHLEVLRSLLLAKTAADMVAQAPPLAAAPKTNEKAKMPAPVVPKVKMAAVLGSLLQQAKKPLMVAGGPPIFKPSALAAWKGQRPSGADLPAHAVPAAPAPGLFTSQLADWKAQRAASGSTGARPAVAPQPVSPPPGTGIGAPAIPAPAPLPAAVKTGALAMPAVRPSTSQLAVHPIATPSPAPLKAGMGTLAATGVGGAAMGGMLASAGTQAAQPGLGDQLLNKGKELGGQAWGATKDFAGGFAQNPMKWDGAHIGTAAGVAALPILHYLLSSHSKKKHDPEDDEA